MTNAHDSRHRTKRARHAHGVVDSRYAWFRLSIALLLSTIGGVGMWSVVVALPSVQTAFGVARGDASLPYTLTMLGFGVSSIAMGRLSDRFGIMVPVILGTSRSAPATRRPPRRRASGSTRSRTGC